MIPPRSYVAFLEVISGEPENSVISTLGGLFVGFNYNLGASIIFVGFNYNLGASIIFMARTMCQK